MARWDCNKDTRIATKSGTSYGAGKSQYNPIGLHVDGYLYRTLLGFSYSFAGMTGISSATLYCRTSTQYYTGFGSDPDIDVNRIIEAWSEGGETGLTTTPSGGGAEWTGQPTGTATNHADKDVTTAESTWFSVDITALMQDAFAAGVFYGLKLLSNDEGNTADMTEIYSRENGSSGPYIIYTPITNVVPDAPTVASPKDGVTTGPVPSLSFTHHDDDGDLLKDYDVQVAPDAAFAAPVWSAGPLTAGKTGESVVVPYAGTALVRGQTYYWRVRTRALTGILTPGPYTAAQQFRVSDIATAAFVQPSAPDALIEMAKEAGSLVPPQMRVRWALTDPAGQPQLGYKVTVLNDNDTVFYAGAYVASPDLSFVVPVDAVRGAFYKVTVEVTSTAGDVITIAQRRCKAQWALAEYRSVSLGAVTSWSAAPSSAVSDGSRQAVVVEFGSTGDGVSAVAWKGSMAEVPLNSYFHWRVWLFAWSGAASPVFNSMALTFGADVTPPPDGWSMDGSFGISTATKVYGTQSLKETGNGAVHRAYQEVVVQQDTDYILSGRIKSDGDSQAAVEIATDATGTPLRTSAPLDRTLDWGRVSTEVWNSGSTERVFVRLVASGAVGTSAYFDAVKLESSRVVTSWNPGLVGAGLSVDAGGIKVDARPHAGATLRLQASAGGTRDIVELGANGLKFGGDTEVRSPSPGLLEVVGGAGAGSLGLTGYIAPVITADQTAWAPAGITTAFFVLAQPNAARAIHGIVPTRNGHVILLWNASGNPLTLKYDSASATDTHRLITKGFADVVLGGFGSALLAYSTVQGRWLVHTGA